jgi:hypothetical protein
LLQILVSVGLLSLFLRQRAVTYFLSMFQSRIKWVESLRLACLATTALCLQVSVKYLVKAPLLVIRFEITSTNVSFRELPNICFQVISRERENMYLELESRRALGHISG